MPSAQSGPALALAALLGVTAATVTPPPPPDFVALVARVSPAVVNIDVVRTVRPRVLDPDEAPGLGLGRVQRGVGSGFILESDGLIVTNHHVVAGHPDLTVTTWNGKRYRARVLGTDPLTDLALLRIPAKNLPALTLGPSAGAQIGQWVLALGSPLGLQRTVTAGILSATEREVAVNERIAFLQTDAAINPGNSGGPLVNMHGQVIGINTAIAEGAQGIGFAIPSQALALILGELKRSGRVVRPWLGISFTAITPELQAQFPEYRDQEGVVIAQVVEGGPADRAGLKEGDVILSLNGRALTTAHALIEAVSRHHPGETVSLLVQRGARRQTHRLTLRQMPPGVGVPRP